jgi:hypothetical protein
MKSLKNIYSLEEFINESKNSVNEEVENYMFFQNLEVIKKNIETLMSLDPNKVDSTLQNGHDWAADHITVAAENVDQVTKFLTTTNESEYVSPQEKERKQREAELRLREQIRKIMDKIKENPEKADIHKLELDIAHAKLNVFELQAQLKMAKERHAKMKK